MSQTTTVLRPAPGAGESAIPSTLRADRMASPQPRWMPRYAIDTGRLVGAECIVGSRRCGAVVGTARSDDASSVSPARAALEAAMGLADDLLLKGRPLPLWVPISCGDLADPELMAQLRIWSATHGGAHRLLGLEIDAAVLHRRSADDWASLAALGYEITLCRAATVGPEAAILGVSRLAFPQSLIRRAQRDSRVAAMVKTFAERAHAQGLEPVIKGFDTRLSHDGQLDLDFPGSWQPAAERLSLDAEGLYALVCEHTGRRAPRTRPWDETVDARDTWDLTWTGSTESAETAASARSNVAQPLIGLDEAIQAIAAGNLDIAIPGTERTDEIGDIARALLLLRDKLAAAERLRAEQAELDTANLKVIAQAQQAELTSVEDAQEILAELAETLDDQVEEKTRHLREREREIVWRLSRATERRDTDTGAHILRMGKISGIIAEAMGLAEADCRMIEIAAQMHDVGKVGIPDEILFKPERLTPQERVVMETHALLGWDILRGSDSPLIQLAAEVALSHHEKWDGTGYPHGLAGEAIPIVGRICALADVFDALMAVRPYKPAWSLEQAIAFIEANVGSHFDPSCVEAFFSRIDDIVAIVQKRDELPDGVDRFV